jgi:glycosyltransferase involved in cell wall biosynthesis
MGILSRFLSTVRVEKLFPGSLDKEIIMKENAYFSIIIPVYNVEKYLPACVNSILRQTFTDFEIILVNDGATDNSPALCDEFAQKDERIKVIHQENRGVSAARNSGLKAAQGKYLLFVDGDDIISARALKALDSSIYMEGEADVILLAPAQFVDESELEVKRPWRPPVFDNKQLSGHLYSDAVIYLCSLSDFSTSVCLKAIRRQFVMEHNILFEEGISWGEDADFSLALYLKAETYLSCTDYIYYYRKDREGSATYSFSEKKYRDLLFVIAKWADKTEWQDDKYFSIAFNNYIAYLYCLLLSGYGKIGLQARKEYKIETDHYAWFLSTSTDRRVRLVALAVDFLGLSLTAKLYNRYEGLKG